MIAAYEFLVITPAIANLIRENKTFRIDSAIQTGKKYGMQLLDDHLWQLYERGQITAADAVDHARHPAELQEKLEKIGKLHEVGDSLVTIHDLPEEEEEREKKPQE
jgi:twitching motility protein PilT